MNQFDNLLVRLLRRKIGMLENQNSRLRERHQRLIAATENLMTTLPELTTPEQRAALTALQAAAVYPPPWQEERAA